MQNAATGGLKTLNNIVCIIPPSVVLGVVYFSVGNGGSSSILWFCKVNIPIRPLILSSVWTCIPTDRAIVTGFEELKHNQKINFLKLIWKITIDN